jgi:DNA transformation protein and related proteins
VTLQDPETIRELFSAFGPVSVRRMFSGAGIFADGVMFGLVIRGEIFLKVDDETRPVFEVEGSKPFVYRRAQGREVALSYWRLPERLMDDADDLARFARAALAAAQRAAAKKSRKRSGGKKRRA